MRLIKKFLVVTVLALLFFSMAIFIPAYIHYKRDHDPDKTFFLPRLKVSTFEIDSLSANSTVMNVRVLLDNKLPVTLRADSLQYRFFIDSVEVLKNRYKRSLVVSAYDTAVILLPLTVFTKDLVTVLKKNERRRIDSVEYRFEASFFTPLFFKKKIYISRSRFLPLIYIPTMSLERMTVDSLNFKRAVLHVPALITNKNVFPLKVIDVKYKFSIEGHNWVKGNIPGLLNIKAKGTTEIVMPMRISFKEAEKTLFDILKKGDKVKYKTVLYFKIDSEDKSLKNSKVVMESQGTVNSLVKFKEEMKSKKKSVRKEHNNNLTRNVSAKK